MVILFLVMSMDYPGVEKIKHLKDSKVLEFEVDKNIMKFLSPKCSIALDGISLTVNNISKKFNVSIYSILHGKIPH